MAEVEFDKHFRAWIELGKEADKAAKIAEQLMNHNTSSEINPSEIATAVSTAVTLRNISRQKAIELGNDIKSSIEEVSSKGGLENIVNVIDMVSSLVTATAMEERRFEEMYIECKDALCDVVEFSGAAITFGRETATKGDKLTASAVTKLYIPLDMLAGQLRNLTPMLEKHDAGLAKKIKDALAHLPEDHYFARFAKIYHDAGILEQSYTQLKEWTEGKMAKDKVDVPKLVNVIVSSTEMLTYFSQHPEEFDTFSQAYPKVANEAISIILHGLEHAKHAFNGMQPIYNSHLPQLDDAIRLLQSPELSYLANKTKDDKLISSFYEVKKMYPEHFSFVFGVGAKKALELKEEDNAPVT